MKNFPEFVVIHTIKKNCLPLLKNLTHTLTHTHTHFLRTDSATPKAKDKDSGSLTPSSEKFLERKRVPFHPVFCTLLPLCTEGKEVLHQNSTLPRRQPVGFSNEG